MTRKDSLKISVTTENKNFMKNKAKSLGFGSVSAFLIEASSTYFRLHVDMSVYRKLTQEINYIGKNINSIVRRINSEKIYSDMDIVLLERYLEETYRVLNQEYARLRKIPVKFTSDNLTKKKSKEVIDSFKDQQLIIPKQVLMEDVYLKTHDSLVLITQMIKESSYQEEDIENFVWDYIYGKTLTSLSENKLIEFSDKIFKFHEIMKIKK